MADVPRNHQSRPWIWLPDGSKLVTYSRASKYAEALTDSYALQQWGEHMTAIGLEENRWILSRVADLKDAYREKAEGSWDALSELTALAKAKAGSHEKAEWGSEFHKLAEQLDLGYDFAWPEGPMGADLSAYAYETEELKVKEVERFVVIDELQAAGSFDRLYDERLARVGDIKTGKADKQQHLIQLALYAHGEYYECGHDPTLDEEGKPTKEGCLNAGPEAHPRTPMGNVDQSRAVLIHVPYQTGTCTLYDLDIAAGWKAATELIPAVKAWRKIQVLHPLNSLPPF